MAHSKSKAIDVILGVTDISHFTQDTPKEIRVFSNVESITGCETTTVMFNGTL